MFAKITESKLRAGGLPTLREGGGGEGEEAVVKLSFGKALAKNLPAVGVGRSAGGVLGIGEEEEEANKRRELIPLNYSDDEEEDEKEKDKLSRERKDNSRLSEREKERKRKEVREKVPGSVEGCWGVRIKWSGVNEVRPIFRFLLFLVLSVSLRGVGLERTYFPDQGESEGCGIQSSGFVEMEPIILLTT